MSDSNIDALKKRGMMALEDGEWEKADQFFEQALNQDAEDAECYLGKLMAELKVSSRIKLGLQEQPFDHLNNCKKASRFDANIAKELSEVNDRIRERNETARKEKLYQEALTLYKKQNAYSEAAKLFDSIPNYKDSQQKADECRKCIERQNAEKSRKEAERKQREAEEAETSRIVAEQRKKLFVKIAKITTPIIASIIVFIIILNSVIIPSSKYKKAIGLADDAQYEQAITLLEELGEYKDSDTKISEIKHSQAIALIEEERYDEAYALLKKIGQEEEIYSNKRERASELLESGDYESAYALLEEVGDTEEVRNNKHRRIKEYIQLGELDSALFLLEEIGDREENIPTKYDLAVALLNAKRYNEANLLLIDVDYKDSKEKRNEALRTLLSKKGSIVSFGAYEQDNEVANGEEPIDWIVLKVEGNRALVISKYLLDCIQYSRNDASDKADRLANDFGWEAVCEMCKLDSVWATCYLRSWLNTVFYSSAFNSDEQTMISATTIIAEKKPIYSANTPKDSKDKVFIFNSEEALLYLDSNEARKGETTAYAHDARGGSVFWWLRSSGEHAVKAPVVWTDGSISEGGLNICGDDDVSVRPAMYITIP